MRRRSTSSLLAIFSGVLLLGAGLAACGEDDSDRATDPPADGASLTTADLADQTFHSTSIEGHALVAKSRLTLRFDADTMAVSAGCNTMSAPYEVTDGRLAWSTEAAATMIGCPDDLAKQDTWLAGLFREGIGADLDDTDLVLTDEGVTIHLAAVTDVPLDDAFARTWTLTTIIDGDTAASVPASLDRTPTIVVDADGQAQVDTGCNTGRTTVDVDGQRLTFSPMALTRMACPGSASQVEQAMVEVLSGSVAASFDGTTLTLTASDAGLAFSVK